MSFILLKIQVNQFTFFLNNKIVFNVLKSFNNVIPLKKTNILISSLRIAMRCGFVLPIKKY